MRFIGVQPKDGVVRVSPLRTGTAIGSSVGGKGSLHLTLRPRPQSFSWIGRVNTHPPPPRMPSMAVSQLLAKIANFKERERQREREKEGGRCRSRVSMGDPILFFVNVFAVGGPLTARLLAGRLTNRSVICFCN